MLSTAIDVAVITLDKAAHAAAWALSKFTPLQFAGVLRYHDSRSRLDAWRDGQLLTLRLGTVEFCAELKG